MVGTLFDQRSFVGVDMLGAGREATGLNPGMNADLLHLLVIDAHNPGLGADPDAPADILRRDRVVGLGELHMAVAVDGAWCLLETGEEHRRQGPQCGPLDGIETLEDLLAHGAVNAGVGDGGLPMGEENILLGEARKLAAPERVLLYVVDPALDLALVPGHRGLGGREERLVVPAKLEQLGIEVRIIPIRLDDSGLEVVDDHAQRHAAKVSECVFQTPDERLGGLSPDGLGVALAGMTEDAPKNMGPAALTISDNPGAAAKVDLHLFARQALHPPKRQISDGSERPGEALHRFVTARESVALLEILIDPSGGQSLGQRRLNRRSPLLATAPSARRRPGGHFGRF